MNKIKASALPYLIGALTGIFVGIIANLLTPYLPPLLAALAKYIATNLLPWIIVVILLFIVLILYFTGQQHKSRVNNQFKLADSMLSLLPNFTSKKDLDDGLHRLVRDLLVNAANNIPLDPRRGVLFLPDVQGEYLLIFEQFGVTNEENKEKEKFYIGSDEALKKERGGLARKVFETSQTCICHFMTEKDCIQARTNGYILLSHEQQENALSRPPYNSLICLPVIGKQGSLGVVCFDSKRPYAFNSQDVREPLNILAKYITVALMIKDELQKLHKELQQAQHT